MTTIGVIVCTRSRLDSVCRTVLSILDNDYANFIVTVIDQSDHGAIGTALRHCVGDPRVRIEPQAPLGLAAGRNRGAAVSHEAGVELLAFTDDDCVADRRWLAGLSTAFLRDSGIGLVFGTTRAADYDRTAGFIPAYEVTAFRVVPGIRNKASIEGIGACMAVRTSVWRQLSGFDELLGSGAPFHSADDADMAVRVLLAGHSVCETPDAVVIHHGFRTWAQGPTLIDQYMHGLGAINTKMLRLAGTSALPPIGALAWRWIARTPVVDLNHVPPRLPRLKAFARGCAAALRLRLEPATGRFIAP